MTHFNILDTRLAVLDAYTHIQSLCQQIESKNSIYTIQTKLKNDMSIGQGIIEFKDANSIVIYFGLGDKINAIYANNDPNDTISIQDFVYLITTIFHEKQHLQQEIDFLTKNDAQTLNLAIEKTFSFYNFEYYKKYEHVFLYEIDAERQAYLDAHQYLTNLYGIDNANELMFQCIIERQKAFPVLTKECHNYQECIQNINQVFHDALSKTDKFDLSKFPPEDCMCRLSKDKKFLLIHSFREIQTKWEQEAFCCVYQMQKDKSLNLLPDTHILKQQPWVNYPRLEAKPP